MENLGPYNHGDHLHSHDCGHSHGVVKDRLDLLERKAARIKSKRVALVAATAIRAGSLFFCPGDDIAAIGLQLYASLDGSITHEEDRHEESAILPTPVRIERGEWRRQKKDT